MNAQIDRGGNHLPLAVLVAVVALGAGWWLRGFFSAERVNQSELPEGDTSARAMTDSTGSDPPYELEQSSPSRVEVEPAESEAKNNSRESTSASPSNLERPLAPRRSGFGDTQLEFGSPKSLQSDPYYNPAGIRLNPADQEELKKLVDVLNARIEDAQALISRAGKQYGDSMIEMGLYEDLSSIDFSKGSSSLAMHGRGNKVVRYDPMEVPEVAQAIRDADDELQSARVLVQQFFEARR